MTRKKNDRSLQTNPQHREEETQNEDNTTCNTIFFSIFQLLSVAEYANFSLPEDRFSRVETHIFIFSTESVLNTVNNTLCTRE